MFVVFLILVSHVNSYEGNDFIDRFINSFAELGSISFIPILTIENLLTAALITVVVFFIIKTTKTKKNLKLKDQYGSARWGGQKERDLFTDKNDPFNNMILSQTERLRMNRPPANLRGYDRNKNVLLIGGSGTGKTRFYVTPNLMQMHSSYVITDPKGGVIKDLGSMFEKFGYKIKVLNLKDLSESMRYNPFRYIKTESDILKFVNVFMKNTKSEGSSSGDDFWVQAERLLYTAYIAFIMECGLEEDKNLVTLSNLINESRVVDEGNGKNPIDLMFEELELENPDSLAVRQYKKYKSAAGKTASSIVISCAARLAPIDLKEARELFSGSDELEIEKLGDRKTFFCVILSDTDSTFNFIAGCFYAQLFDVLCNKADSNDNNALKIHVRCILDEFANIGQIPDFEKIISVIRSRNISANIILQAKSQLKDIYKDKAETIIGNCDTEIFLGGKELSTIKDLSENLGKETIDMYNTSETRSNQKSYGLNYQKLGRELMTRDELKTMDGNECIVEIRGVSPFKSKKYDITKHVNYKYLREYDSKNNSFNVKKFIKKYRNKKAA